MDARTLTDLLARHGPALALYARQWTDAPEDAVQDALVALAGLGRVPENPAAWLFRAVRHRAADRRKADARRKRRESERATWFAPECVSDLDAESAVRALESLPGEQREIIVARLWGGLTLAEAASAAGCGVSTAHRRYEAGIAALRAALGVTHG